MGKCKGKFKTAFEFYTTEFFYGGRQFWHSRQILKDKLSLKRENVATLCSGSNPVVNSKRSKLQSSLCLKCDPSLFRRIKKRGSNSKTIGIVY